MGSCSRCLSSTSGILVFVAMVVALVALFTQGWHTETYTVNNVTIKSVRYGLWKSCDQLTGNCTTYGLDVSGWLLSTEILVTTGTGIFALFFLIDLGMLISIAVKPESAMSKRTISKLYAATMLITGILVMSGCIIYTYEVMCAQQNVISTTAVTQYSCKGSYSLILAIVSCAFALLASTMIITNMRLEEGQYEQI